MTNEKDMVPWLNLIHSVFKSAYNDIAKDNLYKEDAIAFLESDWGKFLSDNLSAFGQMIDKDALGIKSVNIHW